MKVIKPQSLALLTRPYEHQGRRHLGISVLLCHHLDGTPLYTEAQTWAFLAPYMARGFEEAAIPRSQAEYLVLGSAWPPQPPAPTCTVELQVGTLNKKLAVWGERYWNGRRITPPEPFETLPLDWRQAFGGEQDPWNPQGLGAERRLPLPLPRVEYPQHPWTAPDRPIPPAGLGPIPFDWKPRRDRVGTYDQDWFENHYPGLAADLDWRYFNLAPDDQQQGRPFTGDETFRLLHLHPHRPCLEGKLPGLRARAFIGRRKEQPRLEEVPLALMALWFFPDQERVLQIHQGAAAVAEEDAADVHLLLAAVEHHHRPREAAHYQQVLEKRLDPKVGALESLRESDLVPAELAVSLFDPGQAPPNLALERMQRQGEQKRAELRKLVEDHGLEGEEHAPPLKGEPPPKVESLDDLIELMTRFEGESEQRRAELQKQKQAALKQVEPLIEAEGLDAERWLQGFQRSPSRGMPQPLGAKLLTDLEEQLDALDDAAVRADLDAIVQDPKRRAQLQEADRKLQEAHRRSAHFLDPPPRRDAAASARLRAKLQRRLEQGRSLAGFDFTGCDLAGLDLRGADLAGTTFEGADLSSCDLREANLEKALLAHAHLTGTRFDGACLEHANLGGARIRHASFRGADLTGALFDRAQLQGADLGGCRLDEVRWLEARFDGVDFSTSTCDSELLFMETELKNCRFGGVRWQRLVIHRCRLDGADFSDAVIEKAAFVAIQGEGVRFAGLQLGAACFADGCRLPGADFRRCRFHEISLRGARLTQADFRQARLTGCDLAECDLRRADLRGADLRRASLRRADLRDADLAACNLMEANLSHARLDGADFRRANLHGADWARVRAAPGSVQTQGALTTRLRLHPRHREEPGS